MRIATDPVDRLLKLIKNRMLDRFWYGRGEAPERLQNVLARGELLLHNVMLYGRRNWIAAGPWWCGPHHGQERAARGSAKANPERLVLFSNETGTGQPAQLSPG